MATQKVAITVPPLFLKRVDQWAKKRGKSGSRFIVEELDNRIKEIIDNIRKAMGIEPGDLISYELQGKSIKLKRIEPFDTTYHTSVSETLEEWNSPEDEEAFSDL